MRHQTDRAELVSFIESLGFEPNRTRELRLTPEGWTLELVVSDSRGNIIVDEDAMEAIAITIDGVWIDVPSDSQSVSFGEVSA